MEKQIGPIITQLCTTIQGEGITCGYPCLLIRFANCNLDCSWCDSKLSKRIPLKTLVDVKTFARVKPEKFVPFKINDLKDLNILKRICKNKTRNYFIDRLLITGGEPLLNWEYIKNFISLMNFKNIEIETNGTLITPKLIDELLLTAQPDKKIQLNISPKVSIGPYKNSNLKINDIDDIINLFKEIINDIRKAIETYPEYISANLKFVYYKSVEYNITRFLDFINHSNIPVTITPLTPDYKGFKTEYDFIKEFRNSCWKTLEFCLKKNLIFNPRNQIWIFNTYKNRNELEDIKRKINKQQFIKI